MTCIKTGAYVFFDDYGFAAPADLYQVENAIIIRWNNSGKVYPVNGDLPRSVTHNVTVPPISGWHREDIGVTVVSERCVVERV